jgi:hypothetical protein
MLSFRRTDFSMSFVLYALALLVIAPIAIAVGAIYLLFLACGAIAMFVALPVYSGIGGMLGFEPPGRLVVYIFWGVLTFIMVWLLPKIPELVYVSAIFVLGLVGYMAWTGGVPEWLIRISPWMN